MLAPDYILRLSEGAEEIASQLHIDIIRRVIRRSCFDCNARTTIS